ncbi:MAG: ACT domain-containing protein [Sedimentisphaerales bacterium]|nr:ACT domain-containing protein [Sedimentisphaerales bacterium]
MNNLPKLRLRVLHEVFAICSFPPDATLPDWADRPSIFSITKTPKEITIVCEESHVPGKCKKSENWKCIKVEGNFALDAGGVLAGIAGPLAQNEISLYVISTYDTDYVLIHADDLDRTVSCLSEFGHSFIGMSP